MFCEESLGKIKFRAFPKRVGHEIYRLKALITLEQVNTSEWSKKKRILISKIAMVGCLELGMCFRRISYFFIIWRKDHFPFNVYANYRVRAVTACHCMQMALVMSMRFIFGDD